MKNIDLQHAIKVLQQSSEVYSSFRQSLKAKNREFMDAYIGLKTLQRELSFIEQVDVNAASSTYEHIQIQAYIAFYDKVLSMLELFEIYQSLSQTVQDHHVPKLIPSTPPNDEMLPLRLPQTVTSHCSFLPTFSRETVYPDNIETRATILGTMSCSTDISRFKAKPGG